MNRLVIALALLVAACQPPKLPEVIDLGHEVIVSEVRYELEKLEKRADGPEARALVAEIRELVQVYVDWKAGSETPRDAAFHALHEARELIRILRRRLDS